MDGATPKSDKSPSSIPSPIGNTPGGGVTSPPAAAQKATSYTTKIPQQERRKKLPSYESKSNIISWITVSFLEPIFKIGNKRSLTEDDLGVSMAQDKPETLYKIFEKKWNHPSGTKKSFASSIYSATGYHKWFLSIFIFACVGVVQFLPTYIMRDLINDINSALPVLTNQKRWVWTAGLFFLPAIAAILSAWAHLLMVRISVQMKSMSSEAVYRKALRLTSTAKGETSTGQIVNIMSSDTSMLQMFVMIMMFLVLMPVIMIMALRMISEQMNAKLTWIAVSMYLGMILIQMICGGFARGLRAKSVAATDARVKLINEVLNGIRVIKYYCWEKPFKGKIMEARDKELAFTKSMSWLMTFIMDILLLLVPQLVPVVCFSLYESIMGKPLDAGVAFISLTCFGMLVMPFMMLPMALMVSIQYSVSLKRINKFLNLEEVDSKLVIRDGKPGETFTFTNIEGKKDTFSDFNAETDAVVIKDGTFAWGNGPDVLTNINIRIPKGKLVAVVGRVGSGKSSFVSTLMGELTRKTGFVLVNGSMAYSAQQAWLVNDSVRNNILFGSPYDKERYEQVIDNACLRDDLKVLIGGDECEIGERGINVSGGQKARVSVARCAYNDADIMVFDDPIAAVDSHVGKALFNKLIRRSLEGKTRILVTNATQYLHKCDYIIIIDKNTVVEQGTYQELKDREVDILSLLAEEDMSSSARKTSSAHEKKPEKGAEAGAGDSGAAGGGGLVDEENKSTGRVKWNVYTYFFKAVGLGTCFFLLALYIIATTFNVAGQIWMTNWSADAWVQSHTLNFWIMGYIILNVAVVFFQTIRSLTMVPAKIKAAKKLHNDLTTVILNAPISFHDVTPVGRILNRFNKDVEALDFQMAMQFAQLLGQIFSLLGNIASMVYSTNGIIFAILVPSGIVFYIVQDRFRKSNTDIQRIESLTRSPIFTDFQGVLNGTPSIRAFGHQDRFIKGIEDRLDRNNHVISIFQYASAWLQIRSDVISALIVVTVGIITTITIQMDRTKVSGGKFGLALNSALQMSALLKQLVRFVAQTEATMNSVERIRDYIDNVKSEPPMITNKRPPPGWPNAGRIEFSNAKLRYRDGPLVLKGVSARIESKEKIGIVGRTGAGKSSMMIALFRITDLCDGSITIDGVNLADIGLEDVRRALCIIPQDPVLFSETVRFNIDPFSEYSDEDIWSVLQLVELSDAVKKLPKGLEDVVHEGGSNFSVGERQLICMARALLRKPKVLILDEATASLDNETDAYLQMMLRKSFKECTTLTIAHRLNTIMDCNRVMVMDKGVVAEFDTPFNLLHAPSSIFKGMVDATNDPTLFDLVPGCEELKQAFLLSQQQQQQQPQQPQQPLMGGSDMKTAPPPINSSSASTAMNISASEDHIHVFSPDELTSTYAPSPSPIQHLPLIPTQPSETHGGASESHDDLGVSPVESPSNSSSSSDDDDDDDDGNGATRLDDF